MVGKYCARGGEKIDVKILVTFVNGVALHRNVEGLAGFSGREGEDTVGSHIVGASGCAIFAVISRIVDGDCRACRRRQGCR